MPAWTNRIKWGMQPVTRTKPRLQVSYGVRPNVRSQARPRIRPRIPKGRVTLNVGARKVR